MADNILSEDAALNDLETTGFNEEDEPKLYPHYDSNEQELNVNIKYKNRKKYNTFLLLLTALICLLLGIITGGYFQKSFGFIGSENLNNSINNNNEYNIMDQLHIRSKRKREIRGNRTNEEECESRRCCDIRDGLTINDLPKGLNCTLLTDDECGDMDLYCEWDCDPQEYKIRKHQKFRRYFRRISLSQGRWQSPQIPDNNQSIPNNTNPTESYQQCLNEAKLISSDDCGVEYGEELDPELAEILCQSRISSHNISGYTRNGTIDLGENGDGQRRLISQRGLQPLGKDGRVRVTSTEFPYNAAMYVVYTNATGHEKRCSGTLISPRWVLTAAHCVWGGDWYRPIKVFKNILSCSDKTNSNVYKVNKRVVFVDYQTNTPSPKQPDYNNDIGFVRLARDPGIRSYSFGYDDTLSAANYMNNNQYPGDKPDCGLWRQYCSWDHWYEKRMASTTCDGYPGASGAGVYLYEQSADERTIYGVLSSGSPLYAYATRITRGKYLTMCDYVNQETPGHCDCNAMKCH